MGTLPAMTSAVFIHTLPAMTSAVTGTNTSTFAGGAFTVDWSGGVFVRTAMTVPDFPSTLEIGVETLTTESASPPLSLPNHSLDDC